MPTWAEFCKATADRPPRSFLLRALDYYERPGFAIDVGCGAGNETLELLRRGWTVFAVDGEPEAVSYLESVVPPAQRDRVRAEVMTFDRMVLPPADLIWSGLSLSFMHPSAFDEAWATILRALKPGGRVACDIFGPRHVWASDEITVLDEAEVRQKLAGLEVEHFEEQEEDLKTAFDGIQHWHAFWLIARKQGAASMPGDS